MPDLSIIIVNWNTCDLLHNCLRSIDAGAAGLAIQTIVVDNKSADGSALMVAREFPHVQLVQSGGNLGFGRANNLAVSDARAPLVLFLNPDTEIRDQSLQRMVSFLGQNPAVGALGCKIRDLSGGIQELGIQSFPSPLTELFRLLLVSAGTQRRLARLLPYHDPEVSGPVNKLFGACLMVRRQVLEQVGAFDERFFMYCEDVDLCSRIAQAGWTLYYLSDAEILHLGGGASSRAPGAFSVLMTCESLSKFMCKHHGRLGGPAYRVAAFLGAQARLVILLALKIGSYAGWRSPWTDTAGSMRKYLTIVKWAIGLEKPLIRN